MKPPPSIPPTGPDALPSEEERRALVARLTAILGTPAPPLPQRIFVSGRSRQPSALSLELCRFFSSLGMSEKNPSDFEGQGFLELRALDRSLSDAFSNGAPLVAGADTERPAAL